MTSKFKHNKKRNVGILYELLVRNMTRSLMTEDLKKVNELKILIERHFKKNTELYKEYKIFSALSIDLNENKNKNIAKSLIKESKRLSLDINTRKLEKEKSSLIKSINYTFGKKFYFEHIPNYVNLATIQIALNEWKKKSYDIQKTVLLEEKIVNNLMNTKENNYEDLKSDIDKSKSDQIVMNIMTKKINEKYKNMSESQKNLIKSYAFYYENDHKKLQNHLSEQKALSIQLLEKFKKENHNEFLKNKVNQVLKNINVINENKIDDSTIIKFLTISQLITELNSEE